jgi:hypothetical protein
VRKPALVFAPEPTLKTSNRLDGNLVVFEKFIFTSLSVSPRKSGPINKWRIVMEKVIESDISITNVVNHVADEVVINDVPVVVDVPVQVSDATVVDGVVVDPNAVVVNVDHV